MTGILAALGSGISAKKILEFLMRKSPDLAPRITKALASGLTAENVLKFFSKDKNFEKLKSSMEKAYPMENNANPLVQAQNVRSQNLGNDPASALQRAAPSLLGTTAALGAGMALQHALPNLLKTPTSGKTPQNTVTSQIPPMPPGPNSPGVSVLGSPPNQPNAPGGASTLPPSNIINQPKLTETIKSPSDVLWNDLVAGTHKKVNPEIDGLMKIAQRMRTTGEIGSKEDFDKFYNLFEQKKSQGMSLPKALKEASSEFDKAKYEKQEAQPSQEKIIDLTGMGKGMMDNFYEGIFTSLKEDKSTFAGVKDPLLIAAKPAFEAGQIKSIEDLKKFADQWNKSKTQQPTISKNETVASPQGIGEVKEVRGDKALVEVDGKLHKVAVDELENEPEEIKELDLSESVEDYLSRIPEGQKSSVIDISLFDPTTNELQIRFPNGDQWIYGPIPEEVFDKINSMTGIPITSGESKLRGTIWEMGVANSAGADFYKLIKKFVKEGKVKERKLKTGIDLFRGFTRVKKRK